MSVSVLQIELTMQEKCLAIVVVCALSFGSSASAEKTGNDPASIRGKERRVEMDQFHLKEFRLGINESEVFTAYPGSFDCRSDDQFAGRRCSVPKGIASSGDKAGMLRPPYSLAGQQVESIRAFIGAKGLAYIAFSFPSLWPGGPSERSVFAESDPRVILKALTEKNGTPHTSKEPTSLLGIDKVIYRWKKEQEVMTLVVSTWGDFGKFMKAELSIASQDYLSKVREFEAKANAKPAPIDPLKDL